MAAVRAAVRLLRHAPDSVVRAGGSALGLAVARLDRGHRRVAHENLSHAFPDWTETERARVVRAAYQRLSQRAIELVRFSAMTTDAKRACVDVEGADHVRAASAAGRGVLFFSGHFGNWELHAIAHALVFEPVGVFARPLDNPGLHQWLETLRQSTGNVVLYRQGAVRKALRLLTQGTGVALQIDQHTHGQRAVPVQFFGRPVATTSTLAALALHTGAPVVPVFAVPLPGGRVRMTYEPPVAPPPPDAPDRIREFTQRCSDVLERYVRDDPPSWLWMHRRWRDLPPAPQVNP